VQFETKVLPQDQMQNHTLTIPWKAVILNHRMSEGNAKLCLERSDLITLADGQFL
jgi:hypothetical protein